MNGFPPFSRDSALQPPQHNGQHGNYPTNFPSTSSTPFSEFSPQHMNNVNVANSNSQMRLPTSQEQSQPHFNSISSPWGISQQTQQHIAPMLSHPQQSNNQWSNAIPTQAQFMNGMNAVMSGMSNMPMNMNMPALNMSLFQQQMLHDALALSTPVAGADDERLIIDTLVDARARKDNYKNALNSLHGKNGHSATLWKDFYLEWKDKIDPHVSLSLKRKGIPDPLPIVKVAKKPTPASFKHEPSPPPSPVHALKPKGPLPNASSSRSAVSSSPNSLPKLPSIKSGNRRSTINSITAHHPSYNSRLPPPNSEITIPDAPSRSPSPPNKVVPHSRGNKFTKEDKEFFIKFIQWRLRCDQSLTRTQLCEQLAEKAPHHSLQSWAAHWSNNHDLPDKILAAAYGEADTNEEDTEDESSGEEEVQKSRPRKSIYKESSSEGDEQDADDDLDQEKDQDEDFILPSFDESAMGMAGGSFTDADFALTARYVASFNDFSKKTHSSKWVPWSQRYPQRSHKSWAEFYRRNEQSLLTLARKIKNAGAARGLSPKREESENATLADLVPDANGPPKAKRKYTADDQEQNVDNNRSKTSKFE
ncbi:uncharacterized protein C8R40DRAFT_1257666 [Lentinula edodes]|uniref:uncharacterized protein n=1 Tax=Lentinula edodes TaxID=5353 RepID=UPI001E8E0549|nr:uncharacterized protein C8R40DRAFT_1257666 [Lentinula edodes]KAH7870755.1 hypothetical protein C8R40DRAFT_1257666 [Lentinula edodes]